MKAALKTADGRFEIGEVERPIIPASDFVLARVRVAGICGTDLRHWESVYNASKGGVASFAETLRKELIPHSIRLTLIEPGAIGSAMQPFSPEERARMVDEYQLLPPEEVADAILFAATRGPGVDVVTLRIEPLVQKIV